MLRASKLKTMRREKVASPVHETISAAIAEVLNAHGALPALRDCQAQGGGRKIAKQSISHSLHALKKQGRVKMDAAKGSSKPE